MATVFEEEFGKELQTLGDIDMDLEKINSNLYTIDFSLEDVRLRFSSFLNLKFEATESDNVSDKDSENHFSQEELIMKTKRSSIEASSEALKQQEIESEVHELNELKGSSIEEVFQDFNYWKPQVDMLNVDDILTEMNN